MSKKIKLTTRGQHAIMAMVELANQGADKPVPLSALAETGNISLSYLEQLFAGLRKRGLVKSYRGPGGGYVLSRKASDIQVTDILIAAEDTKLARKNDDAKAAPNEQTDALWAHIGEMLYTALKPMSLADVAQGRFEPYRKAC